MGKFSRKAASAIIVFRFTEVNLNSVVQYVPKPLFKLPYSVNTWPQLTKLIENIPAHTVRPLLNEKTMPIDMSPIPIV